MAQEDESKAKQGRRGYRAQQGACDVPEDSVLDGRWRRDLAETGLPGHEPGHGGEADLTSGSRNKIHQRQTRRIRSVLS